MTETEVAQTWTAPSSNVLSKEEIATLEAALEFYASRGMGEACLRSKRINTLATRCGELISLDDEGIFRLQEKLQKLS